MTPRPVRVDLVPDPARVAAPQAGDRDWTGLAVDVLRATSTLTAALENGAAAVVPFTTTEAALAWRDAHPGALACGERGGRIAPGFDLGNSPAEYPRERVAGRTLAFASTNGSRAMRSLLGCGTRWLASFVNAAAAAEAAAAAPRVRIACAGKEGAFALEDAACAGWLLRLLAARGFAPEGEGARLCLALAPRDAGEVRALVEGCDHARVLRELGAAYAADVAWCATLDVLPAAHRF